MRGKHKQASTILSGLAASAFLFGASLAQAENLMEIYQLATEKDPVLRGAQAAYRAAQEAGPQSRANFMPSLGVGASHTENTDEDIESREAFSITLSQPLYRHDNYVQRRIANSSIRQSDAELQAAEQAMMVRVAEGYFGVLSAKDNLEFATAEKEANARQLEQTKQRFDVGLVAITDVHESQAAYDLSVAQAIAAQNTVDSSLEALREITGQYHDRFNKLGVDMPLLPPEPQDLQTWTEAAMTQNPALKAIIESTEQAKESIESQRDGYYPTLDLVLNRTDNMSDDPVYDYESTTAIIQLNMSLFEGGRTDSFVRQALELYNQNKEVLEQQQRATQRQVRNAYRGVLSGVSRVKALKQAQVSNESALRAAEAGYEVGTRTTVDVLVARTNLFLAQRNYAQSRYNYLLDILRLKQAAGNLSTDDLERINSWLH